MDLKVVIEKYPHKLRDTIFKEIMHYEILETLFAIKDIQKHACVSRRHNLKTML